MNNSAPQGSVAPLSANQTADSQSSHTSARGTSSSQNLLRIVRNSLPGGGKFVKGTHAPNQSRASARGTQSTSSSNSPQPRAAPEEDLFLFKAIELYREKNFPESLKYFNRILYKKENVVTPNSDRCSHLFATRVKANFYKACMLYHGNGVKKDIAEANELFKGIWKDMKSVPDSDDDKLFYLARMKDEGWGTRVNKKEALIYYIRSTNRRGTDRNAIAYFNLGLMYYLGEGVHKSYEKTRQMYSVAASMGHMSATYNLAVMYRDGVGGPKNTSEALRLYHLNAQRGDAKSMNSYALMMKQNNPQECLFWLRKAIKKGNAYALYNMAFILENGHIIEQDLAKALHYYQEAARHGHVSAIESASILQRQIRKTLILGNV